MTTLTKNGVFAINFVTKAILPSGLTFDGNQIVIDTAEVHSMVLAGVTSDVAAAAWQQTYYSTPGYVSAPSAKSPAPPATVVTAPQL
jgi:hypothetical protein